MSETKFTPGPWHVVPTPQGTFGKNWVEIAPSVVTSAEYHSSRDGVVAGVQISKANARLIAAAPALYEALKNAERALTRHIPEGHGVHPNPEFEIVLASRAALALADGKEVK